MDRFVENFKHADVSEGGVSMNLLGDPGEELRGAVVLPALVEAGCGGVLVVC